MKLVETLLDTADADIDLLLIYAAETLNVIGYISLMAIA